MNTILQQLYNGEICLIEQYRPILEEYKAIRKKHMDNYKGFIEKLGSPLDKEFIKIMDEQFETAPLDFFQMFSRGGAGNAVGACGRQCVEGRCAQQPVRGVQSLHHACQRGLVYRFLYRAYRRGVPERQGHV